MILSASGGLVYHTRAAFTRLEKLDRWQPTRQLVSMAVSEWLSKTNPDVLVLFGPSAGYLLERDLFRDLSLVIVDPDPLAKLIFKSRFPSSACTWHARADLLPWTSPTTRDFANFLKQVKRSAPELRPNVKVTVLFFGVLGQMALHQKSFKRPVNEGRRILVDSLRDYEWASLHDLESTKLRSRLRDWPAVAIAPADSQEARLAGIEDEMKKRGVQPSEWIDHETAWLGKPVTVIPWLLTTRALHLLGFTTSSQ